MGNASPRSIEIRSGMQRRSFLGLVSTLGLGAAVPGLAACGSSESAGGNAATGTIKVWDTAFGDGTDPGKALVAIDKAFAAKYPKIKVDHELHSWDTYFTSLRTAVTTKKGPDVVLCYGQAFGIDYMQGLEPLDDRLAADAKLDKDLTLVAFDQTCGQSFALPLYTYNVRMYYNKKLFAQAELDPENPPQTWEEFGNAMEALKGIGVTPMAAGLKDGGYPERLFYFWGAQMFSPEESIAASNNLLSFTDTPAYGVLLTHFKELYDNGWLTKGSESLVGDPDPTNEFLAGKAGVVADANSSITAIAEEMGEDNVGVMLAPIFPEAYYDTTGWDASYNMSFGITNWSEKKDAAWTYLSFILGAEAQTIGFDVGGLLPNNNGVDVTSEVPIVQQVLEWMGETEEPRYVVGLTTQTASTWVKRVPQVMLGDFSIDDCLAELEQQRLSSIQCPT